MSDAIIESTRTSHSLYMACGCSRRYGSVQHHRARSQQKATSSPAEHGVRDWRCRRRRKIAPGEMVTATEARLGNAHRRRPGSRLLARTKRPEERGAADLASTESLPRFTDDSHRFWTVDDSMHVMTVVSTEQRKS